MASTNAAPVTVDLAPAAHALPPSEDYPSHIRFRPPPVILTPRLILRRATEDDIPAIHKFLQNEDVMKHMYTKVSQTIEDTQNWYRMRFTPDPVTGKGGGEFVYLICLRDGDKEGEAIGTCGSREAPNLGYQIGAGTEYWGKGYASEAVGAVVAGVCKRIQDEKEAEWEKAYVKIICEEENIASARVAEKIGGKRWPDIWDEDRHISGREYRIYAKDWNGDGVAAPA